MKTDKPHITWLDNFSKFVSRSIPTLDQGLYSSCLWTGEAVFHCDDLDENISDAIKFNAMGEVVPAMPDELLSDSVKHSVQNALQYVHSQGRHFFEDSLVNRYNINNVPLKIDTVRYPEMKQIEDKKNSTYIVNAKRLINHNIGSNLGLINIIRNLYMEKQMHNDTCERYHYYNMDENIFWRVLKVCLNVLFLFFILLHISFMYAR